MRTGVLEAITKSGVLSGNESIVVGVSGGPDSVCLLHALSQLKQSLGLRLHVAHLDHQLRGAESSKDAEYVSRLADKLGLPATIESRDVRAYGTMRRSSLEEAARDVRYAFFAEVAKQTSAAAVAVGHTRDDDVETVLMHILRGTGTSGLRGLMPVNELRTEAGPVTVIRPLLDITRRETAQYCAEHGLGPRTDETNQSLSLFRNRVRLELLPLLRTYNPQIEEALSRLSRIATDEMEFLDSEAKAVWGRAARIDRGTLVLDKETMRTLAPALKRHVLRLAVSEFVAGLKDIETRHIDTLLEAVEAPSGRVFQLPAGLFVVVEHDRCLLGRDQAALCPFPVLEGETFLNVPGDAFLPGWKVTARILQHEEDRRGSAIPVHSSGLMFSACFDYDAIGPKIAVRSVTAGDRFEPLGLGSAKKVSRFMLDAGVPRNWRKRVPILVTPARVAWVVGWRIDERLRVTDATSTALLIDFARV